MTAYTFRGIKGRAEHRFTCPSCVKTNRVRTFTSEKTVNPFNVNHDGSVKTPAEVSKSAAAAARAERDRFITEPLCATCENALDYAARMALYKRRRAAGSTDAE